MKTHFYRFTRMDGLVKVIVATDPRDAFDKLYRLEPDFISDTMEILTPTGYSTVE